ncbi:serine hydrolase domain-containing protein [Catalinimonas niigatensis]|uniref:serine hydrolase domain-containing protein n=1 Tax=Catalinimonas niigatensis TaxID=1397264 RepID=UPI00266679AA|nr:serine hydrolase domain-containing protein [Catalinimonas niigatensis]WPP48169.1 serine hydrolase domain-containing protein [Catalinimonas niigatensis]
MSFFISKILLATLLIVSISFNIVSVRAQTFQGFANGWKKTDTYFQNTLKENQIVGGALLFLEKGEVKGSRYYGMADISQQRAVDENTIFHWASITKTFTAIAIMQLRDRGLLTLDDPVTKYLPELRKVHNPYGSTDDITIKTVLSHSAGFRDPSWPWGGNQDWHPFEPTEWSQIVAMLPYTEILFEPGSKFSYSNPAIIFLGRIIEMLSGDDYEVYIDKNILKPLEMYSSYYDITPYHLLKFRANNYTIRDGEPQPNGLDFDTGITTSNGGLNAPLKDMIKYLNFLTGQPESYEILKRSSLEELWEEQLPISESNGITSSVALSFFPEAFDGMQVVGHTGTQKSFYSFFYLHPPSQTACIAITNTNSEGEMPNPDQIRLDMSHFVFGHLFTLYK